MTFKNLAENFFTCSNHHKNSFTISDHLKKVSLRHFYIFCIFYHFLLFYFFLKKPRISSRNFLQIVWKGIECAFVMIATCKKNFSQKLKGQNFKVPYNLHRGCFQENLNSVALLKARKLIFCCCLFMRFAMHKKLD